MGNTFRKDYSILLKKYQKLGLLEVSKWVSLGEILLLILSYLVGVLIYQDFPILGFIIHLASCITAVWWIHDAGHGAFFNSHKTSKFFAELLGLLYLGMPQIEYHFRIHRIHHAFTNILNKDPALDTGPIKWHPGQKSLLSQSLQKIVWHFFVLPLTYPILTFQLALVLVRKKMYLRFALFFIRWTVLLILLKDHLELLILPPLITGFILGYSASLNHFHLEISSSKNSNTPEDIFHITQNISHRGPFFTWLTGGLNYHIEHHLFPKMPSRNLAIISKDIQELASKYDLPYRTGSLMDCAKQLWISMETGVDKPAENLTRKLSYE